MGDEGRLIAGRYRLTECVGRGGMGAVWRSWDEVLDRQVAVKRLHASPHLSDDEVATLHERTRREARSAARITHPHVVVVHDVVDDAGLPCIVMEFVPGSTLDERVRREGRISPYEAARIGRYMVAALRAAHTAGVLHRDVKPANVLLGRDGRVVLTDFGIAVASGTSTLTKTGELVGSVDFVAPERVKGGTPGPASDLWALGATLYQAVEGRPPFRRDTAIETAYAIATEPLPDTPHAGSLRPLLDALLAKDPNERPTVETVEQTLWNAASEAQTAPLRWSDGSPVDPRGGPAGSPTGGTHAGGTPAGGTPTPGTPVPDAAGPRTSHPAGPTGSAAGDPSTGAPPGAADGTAPTGRVWSTEGRTAHQWHGGAGQYGEAASADGGRQRSAGTDAPGGAPTGGRWSVGQWSDDQGTGGDRTGGRRAPSPGGAPAASAAGRARGPRLALFGAVGAVFVAAAVAGYLLLGGNEDSDGVRDAGPTAGSTLDGGAGGERSRQPFTPPPVPEGHHLVEEPSLGVSFPVPDGWRRKTVPDGVSYVDPSGQAGLKINVLDFASSDPLQHWKDIEPDVRAKQSEYRRLRMQDTTYRGEPAAVWEFSFAGTRQRYRAVDLGWGEEGGNEYAIYLSAPSSRWDEFKPVFDTVKQGLDMSASPSGTGGRG